MPSFSTDLISMLVVLGIMVLVHETGHFLVAKMFGVRVEVFSIGFGKRLFGFKRGDTDYRISLLPLGGYVKMSGENPGEETSGDPAEFTSKPRWQRILIGLAGPVANFLLAFALVTGLYMMHNEVFNYLSQPAVLDGFVPPDSPAGRAGIQGGDRIVRYDNEQNPTWEQVDIRTDLDLNSTIPVVLDRNGQTVTVNLAIQNPTHSQEFDAETLGLLPKVQEEPLSVEELEHGMPAEKAGLKAGDRILAVDGHQLHYVRSFLAYLQMKAGQQVNLTVLRKGETLNLTIQPALADDGTGHRGYRLGFQPGRPPFHVEQLPLIAAVKSSVKFNARNSGYILEVLHKLFTRQTAVQNLSGPVGIAQQTGLAISMPGWQPIIDLMALISLNLGIFNLLPIPILDGGMILLLLIEGTIRRDINQEVKERIYQVAFVVLILFAVFVMFNDFSKLPIFSRLKP
jgi:regulator of sigma E protease